MAVGRDLRSGCGDVAHPRSQEPEYAAGKMNDTAPSMKIPHRRYAQGSHPLSRAGPGQRTKEATMTIKLVAVLLCLMTGTAVAQEPKVTSLMSKDLPENPGREALMVTCE